MLLADHEQVYAFTRCHDTTELLVLANFSGGPATIEVPDTGRWQGTELILTNYPVDDAEDIQHLALRPWEARVYRARSPVGRTADNADEPSLRRLAPLNANGPSISSV
jgi:oligo-1,6-glucosidase